MQWMTISEAALQAKLAESLALQRQGRLSEAEKLCGQILQHRPNHFHALHLLGVLALQTGRTQRGVDLLSRAIATDPNFAAAYLNRGNGLRELGDPQGALADYDKALVLQLDFVEAYSNRGNALIELRRNPEALASYDRAIALRPGYAEAYVNRSRALFELERYEEALASSDRAIALNPRLATAWGSRAVALNKLKRCDEAISAYARVLDLDPRHPFIKGMLLYQKMQSCDWNGIAPLIADIEQDVAAGKMSVDPFAWQGAARSPKSLQLCAERFSQKKFPAHTQNFAHARFQPGQKIRVGYLSGEFREHATSLLLAGVWEHHDASQFEIFAFDNGQSDKSATRGRIERVIPHIIDIRGLSDSEAAASVHQNRIDILVNLNGYFGGGRTGVFAQRPAPIQVNYLGFPGTLGTGYMDYMIADRHVLPNADQEFYNEKIVYLPNCYQANDDRKKIVAEPVSRAEHGLPEEGFVFCCFNNNYKILPDMFDRWMRILHRAPASVLWLLKDNPDVPSNLKKETAARGVDPQRLIFADRKPLSAHLARHRCADLFLDTLPYNAHTTASDALWAGLPVLTCAGETFPGRVAASLLHAIDMPELIATSLADYENLAVELAANPDRLAALKRKLVENRLTTKLFDTASYTRDIEAAYRAMFQRHRAGLPPDHIAVPAA